MFVTGSYDNHIFVVYIHMTFTFKAPMYSQIMSSFYVTWPKPFSGLPVTRIQRIMHAFQQ